MIFAVLLAVQDVALAELLGPQPAAFPRVMRIALCAVEPASLPTDETLDLVSAYYRRVSRDRFLIAWSRVEGVSTKADLATVRMGSAEEIALTASWLKSAATGVDAVCFIVPRRGAVRGWFLWPHTGEATVGRRKVPYTVVWADSGEGETVGVHAHEIGHLAGLVDEYEHQEVEEGIWCVMSRGYEGGRPPGRSPAPPCAPCRLKLGWIAEARPELKDPRRIAFGGEEACLSLDEEMVVERRGEHFLIWERGRLKAKLGEGESATLRPAELKGAGPGVLEIAPRPARGRFLN